MCSMSFIQLNLDRDRCSGELMVVFYKISLVLEVLAVSWEISNLKLNFGIVRLSAGGSIDFSRIMIGFLKILEE